MHTRGLPDYFQRSTTHPYPDPGPPPPRFAIGDLAYALTLYRENVTRTCPVCDGAGDVEVSGSEYRARCPEPACRRGKIVTSANVLHASIRMLTIRQVRTETTARANRAIDSRVVLVDHEVGYMASETGVGSGTVWPEDRLFATREDAAARAAKHDALDDRGAAARAEHAARF